MKISETIEYKMIKSKLQNKKEQISKLEIESLLNLIENVEMKQITKSDIGLLNVIEMCKSNIERIDRLCESGINTDVDIRHELRIS